MRPLVGITQCLDDGGRWKPGRRYGYGDLAYAHAVEAAGGLPLLLPVQENAGELLDRIDALLVPGGDDFPPPAPYPAGVEFEETPPAQIAFDAQLLRGALARDLPVLGICYGMQHLGLLLGATLHYHLPLDRPEAQPHSLPEPDGRHPLEVAAGTRLYELLGGSAEPVNSLHHQAIADPGPELCVSASSPDGVIEAIESSSQRFCMGVQWHPERLAGEDSRRLFVAFVSSASRSG